jgi:CheY-like chemotaxis protein
LIDTEMPGMAGEALGQAIRVDRRLAGTRTVMLTSLRARDETRRFEETGIAASVSKPIRHQELLNALSRAVSSDPDSSQRRVVPSGSAGKRLRPFAGVNARILLAEDNVVNQQVALAMLRKLGLRADAVADGAEAVKALESIPYDLVLMDVCMPVLDGIEATRQIRDPESKVGDHAIPIIALTANAMKSDREQCLDVGMNDYLSKPVSRDGLLAVIGKWLGAGNGGFSPLAWTAAQSEAKKNDASAHDRKCLPGCTPGRGKRLASPDDAKTRIGSGARILVAEDDPTCQELTLAQLRTLGIEADAVGTGAEAIEAVRDGTYGLVLMDVRMPVMDGIEATRCIRASAHPGIPIIAVTAAEMPGDRDRCRNEGMNDFLTKPVKLRQLTDMLAKWLPTTGGSDAAQTQGPYVEPPGAIYDENAQLVP